MTKEMIITCAHKNKTRYQTNELAHLKAVNLNTLETSLIAMSSFITEITIKNYKAILLEALDYYEANHLRPESEDKKTYKQFKDLHNEVVQVNRITADSAVLLCDIVKKYRDDIKSFGDRDKFIVINEFLNSCC